VMNERARVRELGVRHRARESERGRYERYASDMALKDDGGT